MYCPICQRDGSEPIGVVMDRLVSQESFALDRCPHCGFIRTANAPRGAALGRYYKSKEYISHSDTHKTLFDRLYHYARRWMLMLKRRWVLKYLPSQEKREERMNLLDIGCGTGYFAHYMQQHGCRVTTIEQDADARSLAFEKQGLSPYTALLNAPLEEKSFDLITLWHVLEHIDTLEEHFNTITRLIKPNGLLVLALPNPTSWDARVYKMDWAAWDVPRHLWHFSPDNIVSLAERYDFRLKAVRPMWLDVYYIALLSEQRKGTTPFVALLKALPIAVWGTLRTMFKTHEASSLIYFFIRS